jgi:hypothetical protein
MRERSTTMQTTITLTRATATVTFTRCGDRVHTLIDAGWRLA